MVGFETVFQSISERERKEREREREREREWGEKDENR